MGIRDFVKKLIGEPDAQNGTDSTPYVCYDYTATPQTTASAATKSKPAPTVPESEKKYYQDDSYYQTVAHEGTAFERKIITFEERKRISYPSARGLYVAEILLLHYCTFGQYPHPESGYPGFWWYKYGIRDVGETLHSLEQRGFIRLKPESECLNTLTVSQLKPFLLSKELPVARKKSDIIKSIKENYHDSELSALGVEAKYGLTELGEQELSENEYVPYMHGHRLATLEGSYFGPEFNVWSINKLIHNNPKRPYRDVIWGELNRMLLITIDNYGQCRNVHLNMYYFCVEEKRWRDAFCQLAIILWYDVAIIAPKDYISCKQAQKYDPKAKVHNLLEVAKIAPGILQYANEAITTLAWTEDDTYKALLNDTEGIINPCDVFSQADFVLYVMAAIYDKPDEQAAICSRLENKLK